MPATALANSSASSSRRLAVSPCGACSAGAALRLARPRARPVQQESQREPVVLVVLQATRRQRRLGHGNGRHALLCRGGAELGWRRDEILAAHKRPVGVDRAALFLEEGTG